MSSKTCLSPFIDQCAFVNKKQFSPVNLIFCEEENLMQTGKGDEHKYLTACS